MALAFYIPYALMFVLLLLTARISGNRGSFTASCVLATVWMCWSTTIEVSGNYEPWVVGVFLDAVAAYLLLIPGPRLKVRAVVAGLYALQIAGHVVYGYQSTYGHIDPYKIYGTAIDVLFWAQILVVGGWSIADILRNWRFHPILPRKANSGDFLAKRDGVGRAKK